MADALASGASVRNDMWVQVPSSAPSKKRTNPMVRFLLNSYFLFDSLFLLNSLIQFLYISRISSVTLLSLYTRYIVLCAFIPICSRSFLLL